MSVPSGGNSHSASDGSQPRIHSPSRAPQPSSYPGAKDETHEETSDSREDGVEFDPVAN